MLILWEGESHPLRKQKVTCRSRTRVIEIWEAAAFQDSYVHGDWCIQIHKTLEKMDTVAYLKNAFSALETHKG